MMILLRFLFIALMPLSAVQASTDAPSVLCYDIKFLILIHPQDQEVTIFVGDKDKASTLAPQLFNTSRGLKGSYYIDGLITHYGDVSSGHRAIIETTPIENLESEFRASLEKEYVSAGEVHQYQWGLSLHYPTPPIETIWMPCYEVPKNYTIKAF